MTSTGKQRRLDRVFRPLNGRLLVCPLDDSLLSGPVNGLESIARVIAALRNEQPSATVLFKGSLVRFEEQLRGIPVFLNCTASITGALHSHKAIVHTVDEAVRLGADGIAAHCNLTSEDELNQLSILGTLSREAEATGLPLLAIMYPRRSENGADDNYITLRENEPELYAKMVSHAVRVGVELGADIIKTQYTHNGTTFQQVIAAAMGVPVVIAGGPKRERSVVLAETVEALRAGAAGVSYGRNTFGRQNVGEFLRDLKKILISPVI